MNNFKYLGVLNLFRSGSSLVRKKPIKLNKPEKIMYKVIMINKVNKFFFNLFLVLCEHQLHDYIC